MWFIGVEVDKRRVHPLLRKILDPPLMVIHYKFSLRREVLPLVAMRIGQRQFVEQLNK